MTTTSPWQCLPTKWVLTPTKVLEEGRNTGSDNKNIMDKCPYINRHRRVGFARDGRYYYSCDVCGTQDLTSHSDVRRHLESSFHLKCVEDIYQEQQSVQQRLLQLHAIQAHKHRVEQSQKRVAQLGSTVWRHHVEHLLQQSLLEVIDNDDDDDNDNNDTCRILTPTNNNHNHNHIHHHNWQNRLWKRPSSTTTVPSWDEACALLTKYEFMEQTSLLELAIWKWRNVSNTAFTGQHQFNSKTDVELHLCKFRQQNRLTSGAAIIIKGVLPFLLGPRHNHTHKNGRAKHNPTKKSIISYC